MSLTIEDDPQMFKWKNLVVLCSQWCTMIKMSIESSSKRLGKILNCCSLTSRWCWNGIHFESIMLILVLNNFLDWCTGQECNTLHISMTMKNCFCQNEGKACSPMIINLWRELCSLYTICYVWFFFWAAPCAHIVLHTLFWCILLILFSIPNIIH